MCLLVFYHLGTRTTFSPTNRRRGKENKVEERWKGLRVIKRRFYEDMCKDMWFTCHLSYHPPDCYLPSLVLQGLKLKMTWMRPVDRCPGVGVWLDITRLRQGRRGERREPSCGISSMYLSTLETWISVCLSTSLSTLISQTRTTLSV